MSFITINIRNGSIDGEILKTYFTDAVPMKDDIIDVHLYKKINTCTVINRKFSTNDREVDLIVKINKINLEK